MAIETIRHPQVKFGMFWRVSSLLIIIFQLVSCSFPGFPESKNELNVDRENGLVADLVNIRFTVKIPQNLLEGEGVALEILDEVTGFSINNQTFDLKQINDQEYSINLSIATGSVLKYRYIKTGQIKAYEAQFNGDPVRYRLCFADNNNSITDILYAWQEETSNLGLGVVTGIIRDQESGSPIPDIQVSAGGQLTFTDANGEFVIGGLPQGEHNVTFYAMDGKYQSYQQGAQIASGLTTNASVNLHKQNPVTVTFSITPPNEALGAPIYIAGNILQLGNTFSNLNGSTNIHAKKMPSLSVQEDGSYSKELRLYPGTDLRYKFTLGDGYWNAERYESGDIRIRKLIVPPHDININLSVDTWRTQGFAPITFHVTIPYELSPRDEKFIQFESSGWTQPLPLWPVGGAEYLYILYSPLDDLSPISYRFCRNADCQEAINESSSSPSPQIIPSNSPITITTTIEAWENWYTQTETNTLPIPLTPLDAGQYVTSIELTPQMDPSWQEYASQGLGDIAAIGTKSVIFSPQWYLAPTPPLISPKPGKTPFVYEIIDLLNEAKTLGLNPSLFPQLTTDDSMKSWWLSMTNPRDFWDEWFKYYKQFILNYAKIAQQTNADQLILGGKATVPTYTGGIFPDEIDSSVPEISDNLWTDLIGEIRKDYKGNIYWATNVSQKVDPLPDFIDQFDGIYVIIDSPLSSSNDASFEDIAFNFTGVIDNFIYEIYRSTLKPIMLALAYPSVDGASRGCALISDSCYNDGLFLSEELENHEIDLYEQNLIYAAILPVISSRAWITGIAFRGYIPTVLIQDGSSSISGKPASALIGNWIKEISNRDD